MTSWKKMTKRGSMEKTFGREEGKSVRFRQVGWIILAEVGFTKNDKVVTMGENY